MKSVIVIGAGSSLLSNKLGSKIDEFDEVVRINDWRTVEWKDYTGLKTTIWCTYDPNKKFVRFIKSYTDRGYSIEFMRDITKQVNEIWYVAPKTDLLLNAWKANKPLKDLNIYNRCKRHQSPSTCKKLSNIIRHPTTGFIVIWLLTRMYDKIYLAGFDFAGQTDSTLTKIHYYADTPMEKHLTNTLHEVAKEYEYIKNLISEGQVEYLKEDTIIQPANYIGKELNEIKCECGKVSKLYDWEQPICQYCEGYL